MRLRLSMLVFVILLLAVTVSAAAAAPLLQEGTPVIEQTNVRSGPLWLGLLLLGAPAVFIIWRAWQKKEIEKRTACGCLPIIDEDSRPFAIQDDDPA